MIIAFDGVCVLCNGFVRFVLRHDRHGRFRFASSGSEAGRAIFAAAHQDPENPVSVVLVDGSDQYLESDAIIRAVGALGGPWSLVAALRIVPRALRDAGYRLVARNRYRWFGRTECCAVPEPGWTDRFLA